MVRLRARGEEIRRFILAQVDAHPADIGRVASTHFGITRQAINLHLKKLVDQQALEPEGSTKNRTYRLQTQKSWQKSYVLASGLEEDPVWRNDIAAQLGDLPDNVMDIWHYGFTEMLNNSIDHSEGKQVIIELQRTASDAQILIADDGEGIFRRIQRLLKLEDERHAILELAKGKLTTDPANHTGEGIYFSSRMFDQFAILSGGVYFSHEFNKPEDWIMERETPKSGTTVFMRMTHNSARTVRQVFDKYTAGEDFGFKKTIVPVNLARYGNEMLVSRSQGKRLLARVDRFQIVIFDFENVDRIGQAFADEVFRVFKNKHPEMQLHFINAVPDVQDMIIRALDVNEAG